MTMDPLASLPETVSAHGRDLALIHTQLLALTQDVGALQRKSGDYGGWIKALIDRDGARLMAQDRQDHRIVHIEREMQRTSKQLEEIYAIIWRSLVYIAVGSSTALGAFAWSRIIANS